MSILHVARETVIVELDSEELRCEQDSRLVEVMRDKWQIPHDYVHLQARWGAQLKIVKGDLPGYHDEQVGKVTRLQTYFNWFRKPSPYACFVSKHIIHSLK
eukprot:g387.t1